VIVSKERDTPYVFYFSTQLRLCYTPLARAEDRAVLERNPRPTHDTVSLYQNLLSNQ